MWKNNEFEFVKYYNGNAYYTMAKRYVSGLERVTIRHLMSHGAYEARMCDLQRVQWENIPESYRMDACAINNFIRDNCDDYPEIVGPRRTKPQTMKLYTVKQYGDTGDPDEEYEVVFVRYNGKIYYMWASEYNHARNDTRSICLYDLITDEDMNNDCHVSKSDLHVLTYSEVPQEVLKDAYLKGDILRTNEYIVETELPVTVSYKTEHKKKTSMKSNFLGTLGLEFGKYEGDDLALSMAGVAARKKDGGYVVYDTANKQLIDVGDLKMDVPFFMMPTAYDAIQEGDLMKIDGQFLIVVAKTADGGLRCISPTTGNTVNKVARTNLWGCYFYTKIISLFNFGQTGQTNPMQNMMGNPMMMMLMMGKGEESGSMDNMMEMMLMGQIMGAGQNPFGAMFGAQPAQTIVQTSTRAPRATSTKRIAKKK